MHERMENPSLGSLKIRRSNSSSLKSPLYSSSVLDLSPSGESSNRPTPPISLSRLSDPWSPQAHQDTTTSDSGSDLPYNEPTMVSTPNRRKKASDALVIGDDLVNQDVSFCSLIQIL